jgi:FtsH-binding integral membrane protein
MIRVYNYMAGGVALTGVVAYFTNQMFGQALYGSPLMYVLIFAPLALVFFLSWRIESLSASTARALFFVYAALLGASLSMIFAVYTDASITRVFFISAAAFGGSALWGYTTQRDLTGMGSFLMMGLIGVIIASLVNIFLKSSGLDWIISVVGVLVFAGLTAYDTQKIKEMYSAHDDGTVGGPKGRDGRADALSRLHQPVPDAAAHLRRPPLSLAAPKTANAPDHTGRFVWGRACDPKSGHRFPGSDHARNNQVVTSFSDLSTARRTPSSSWPRLTISPVAEMTL